MDGWTNGLYPHGSFILLRKRTTRLLGTSYVRCYAIAPAGCTPLVGGCWVAHCDKYGWCSDGRTDRRTGLKEPHTLPHPNKKGCTSPGALQ